MTRQVTDTIATGSRSEDEQAAAAVAPRTRLFVLHSTEAILVVLLAALIAVFLLTIGDKFVSGDNLFSMAVQLPELGILTLAMMVSLIHGGVNLAIISTANMSALTMAYLLSTRLPAASGFIWWAWIVIAIAAGISVSILIGLLNGFIIAYIGVSPILTTLGMMIMVKGLAIGLTRGIVISGFPAPIRFIGDGTIMGVPFGIILFAACAIVVAIILSRTPFGASIYLMGSNERATQFSGVNTRRVIIGIYTMSSILAAVAGLVMLSRFNSANAAYGESYLLVTVLASILGGTDPFGGFGKVERTHPLDLDPPGRRIRLQPTGPQPISDAVDLGPHPDRSERYRLPEKPLIVPMTGQFERHLPVGRDVAGLSLCGRADGAVKSGAHRLRGCRSRHSLTSAPEPCLAMEGPLITRTAIFEGEARPEGIEAFFKGVTERLAPIWRKMPHGNTVRVYRPQQHDDGAPPILMIQEIDYPSREAFDEAMKSSLRPQARAITEDLLRLVKGRVYHVVSLRIEND